MIEPASSLSDPVRIAYLSLGSNIDPAAHIPACLQCLAGLPASRVLVVSSWYRTAPWGGATDAPFINLAVAVRTSLATLELLRATQSIEARLGRERTLRHGARTIDIDLLLVGDELHGSNELRIPHPGLTERDFMLAPLLEIAPDLRHPATAEPLQRFVGTIRYRQIIERLG